MADAHPTVTKYKSDLAVSLVSLGALLRTTGELAEARTASESALAILQRLADAHPTVTEHQSNLAGGRSSLGVLLFATGELAQARTEWNAALVILQKLADAHPTVTQYQSDLANNRSNLGSLLGRSGAPAEARKPHEAALAIQQKLAREHPESPKYAIEFPCAVKQLGRCSVCLEHFPQVRHRALPYLHPIGRQQVCAVRHLVACARVAVKRQQPLVVRSERRLQKEVPCR